MNSPDRVRLLEADEVIGVFGLQNRKTTVQVLPLFSTGEHAALVQGAVARPDHNYQRGEVAIQLKPRCALPGDYRLHIGDAGGVVAGDTEDGHAEMGFQRIGWAHHGKFEQAFFAAVARQAKENRQEIAVKPMRKGVRGISCRARLGQYGSFQSGTHGAFLAIRQLRVLPASFQHHRTAAGMTMQTNLTTVDETLEGQAQVKGVVLDGAYGVGVFGPRQFSDIIRNALCKKGAVVVGVIDQNQLGVVFIV